LHNPVVVQPYGYIQDGAKRQVPEKFPGVLLPNPCGQERDSKLIGKSLVILEAKRRAFLLESEEKRTNSALQWVSVWICD
jgi:hypothetical protein